MDEDRLITCPYDSKHVVHQFRFQRHLVKCEKKYPPLEKCRYNFSHRFPSNKTEEHYLDCPERHIFIRQLFNIDDFRNLSINITSILRENMLDSYPIKGLDNYQGKNCCDSKMPQSTLGPEIQTKHTTMDERCHSKQPREEPFVAHVHTTEEDEFDINLIW